MNRRSAGPTVLGGRSPPIVTQEPRRAHSTSKLGNLFRGDVQEDSKLQEALNDLAITSKLTLKAAECQRRGTAKLADWARSSGNAAIEDVMGHTNDIFQIHVEKLSQFARDYDHFIQHLGKIQDAELSIKKAETKLSVVEEKERKLKKEIRRGASIFRTRKVQDMEALRQQLAEIQQQREMAERTLSDTRAEMEVVKMFRFRNGMKGIADAYMHYTATAAAIFGCHREITEMVPAISTQDVRRMVYDGMSITRDRMDHLRRSLESPHDIAKLTAQTSQLLGNPRRRSEPSRRHRRGDELYRQGTPPPPYTPTAPADDRQSLRGQQSESHISGSNASRPSHLHPIPTHLSAVVAPPPPPSASHLHQIVNSAPLALAQLATPASEVTQQRRDRRSLPSCTGCAGRLYPELPPNPYVGLRAARDD